MGNSEADVLRELSQIQSRLANIEGALARNSSALDTTLVEALMRDSARGREAEEQLAFAQSWVHLAQQAGGVGGYYMDVLTGDLSWSASTYQLYGLDPACGNPTLDTWLAAIHPDDRDQVRAVAFAAINSGSTIDHEFRLQRADGSICWIRDRGTVQLDIQGRPVRLFGMNIDITELKRVQAALSDSEAQFRYTFEHARIGVAHVAPDGRFMEVNQYLCDLLGRSRDELMSMTFRELTHPDDLAADENNVDMLLNREADSYMMEKRYLRPDGTSIWGELSVSLRRDQSGNAVNFIAVVADIEARKRAEEQVSLALREAHHRSTNLLAVMGALVEMSAKTANSVEAFQISLRERLRGLVASQNLLFRKGLSNATLDGLVERQVVTFTGSARPRVRLRGPRIELATDAVQTLGMVVHELCTNACKYGALSSDLGEVEIAWQVDEMDDQLHFTWAESGGPPVQPPPARGFGSYVLERSLKAGLNGKAALHFDPAGVRFEATIPLARLTQNASSLARPGH